MIPIYATPARLATAQNFLSGLLYVLSNHLILKTYFHSASGRPDAHES